MKKLLLATTALAGIALSGPVLANGDEMKTDNPVVTNPHFKVTLGGFLRFQLAVTDQDTPRAVGIPIAGQLNGFGRGYEFRTDDSEIYVDAIGTSDRGMTYGVSIQLEAVEGQNGNIDEGVLFMSGSWGRLELGAEDDAADTMAVGGEDRMRGFGGYDGFSAAAGDDTFNFGQDHLTTTDFITRGDLGQVIRGPFISFTSDATKMTYYTPRYAGFQLGFSWTPDAGHRGDNLMNDNNGNFENILSAGLNYKNSWNGLGFEAALVGQFGDHENALAEDLSAFQVGMALDYAGFSLAAAYSDHGDSGVLIAENATGTDAGYWWDVSLAYATGPWGVALGYFSSERDIGTVVNGLQGAPTAAAPVALVGVAFAGADVGVDTISLTGDWTVAPGLVLKADINFVDVEYVDTNVSNGVVPTAVDNDGFVFALGTEIAF